MANFITITGRIGEDAEVRFTTNDRAQVLFNVADDQSYKDKQGSKVEKTCWFNIVQYLPKDQTISQYLVKGKEVTIYGKETSYKVENEEGTRYFRQVIADQVILQRDPKSQD